MALDGRGYFPRTNNWPAPEPGEIEYGAPKEEAMEENMVVLLHARSSGGTRHAAPNSRQGRRL